MDDVRLPAHVEISALIRRVEAVGGFATVLAKGERDGGTIMIVSCEKGGNFRAWERMPQADGRRVWTAIKGENPDDPGAFTTFIERRRSQDRDLWIVELDVAEPERFIG
ncbi:MAG: DUF1491 family protein [Novosphingobium sp.]